PRQTEPIRVVQPAQAILETRRPGRKLDPEGPVDAERVQAGERALGLVLLEDREQLLANARTGQQTRVGRSQQREGLRLRVHPKAEPRLVSRCSEDARGIVDERPLVQDAHELLAQMLLALERIDE